MKIQDLRSTNFEDNFTECDNLRQQIDTPKFHNHSYTLMLSGLLFKSL